MSAGWFRVVLAGTLCLSSCECPKPGTGARVASTTTPPVAAGGAATASDNDYVALRETSLPAVIVVGGEGRDGSCLQNERFEGSGTIDLHNRIENKVSCPSEVVGFSRGQAVELNDLPTWSHDAAKPLELTMRTPLSVRLRLYVPASLPEQQAVDEMDMASALFANNRGGLVFADPDPVTYTPDQGLIIGTGCGGAANLPIAGPAAHVYDPAVINVYYVNQINSSNVYIGYSCSEPTTAAQTTNAFVENVIYISIWNRAPTTLAHELGHALGLRGNVAHTNGIAGFTVKNLMLAGVSWTQQAAQDHFSLGQGYRMSLDQLSWLNHTRPNGAAAIRSGPTRPCQTNALRSPSEPCPKLVLDP